MLSKIIRFVGLFCILSTTFISVFLALTSDDIFDSNKKNSRIFRLPGTIEDWFYDRRSFDVIKSDDIYKKIVLADINDQSLNSIGQWPLPRTVWRDMIQKLDNFGAKIIAFDVFFPEASLSCKGEDNPDNEFANSIKKFQSTPGKSIIISYSLAHDNKSKDRILEELPEVLYDFLVNGRTSENATFHKRKVSRQAWPIPAIVDVMPGLGFIGAETDLDGVFRKYRLLANIDDFFLPSLALLTFEKYTGLKPEYKYEDVNMSLNAGDLLMSINGTGETKIRWKGDQSNFPSVSIIDILNTPDDDQKMKEIFNNNIVFVGSTAFGAHDLRNTPINAQLPGVYAHINMLYMMLENFGYKKKRISADISWYLIIGASLVIIVIQIFGNAILDFFIMMLIGSSLFFVDRMYFIPEGYEVKLFFCFSSVVACYLWNTLLNFYLANKEKKQIKGTFSRYVAPAIVDEMLSDPEKLKVGGEKKNITVFFSDVRDFTSISEQLTPELLSKSLNLYMGEMTDLIFNHFGTLDKYIGDAIVAFWGAPIPIKDHAYQAVKTSLKMIEILPRVNETLVEWNVPEFRHGIGINTGDCSVGNMGSDMIFAYTALGDSMNLGARLESLCKFYGVQLNVSEYTMNAIPEELRKEFVWRIIDKVKVKGKKEAVTMYEVLHSFHHFLKDQQALADYNGAFDMYLNREFTKAQDIFKGLKEKYPDDKSSVRMFDSCGNFINNPPLEDWDGAYVHTTKG